MTQWGPEFRSGRDEERVGLDEETGEYKGT
jgi:hypothetical protein